MVLNPILKDLFKEVGACGREEGKVYGAFPI